MKRKALTFAAIGILAALSFGSPLSASPAGKQPIRIDSRETGVHGGSGNFVVSLGKGGDIGKLTFTRSFGADKTAPDGLQYATVKETDTLNGKNGTLVIRYSGAVYSFGLGTSEVWEGTWSIGKGTGDYTGLTGRGRWLGASNLMNHSLVKRSTGFAQP